VLVVLTVLVRLFFVGKLRERLRLFVRCGLRCLVR
jgi:hypothetical protein